MIVYQKTKSDFSNDILSNEIDIIISKCIYEATGRNIAPNEMRSFKNSLSYIDKVINDNSIPHDSGISIEYHIPQTSKRIDFMISGKKNSQENVVLIELKQWEKAYKTESDGIVRTFLNKSIVETTHPSYQAYAYASTLSSFNEAIYSGAINIYPCAYLHNYAPDNDINDVMYKNYLEKAPVFLKNDALNLRNFIASLIETGDNSSIFNKIENGKIRPSKSLADSIHSILNGNKEFDLLDDQKVVFEIAKKIAIETNQNFIKKNVIIVKGGPGTGKSVIAINLLVDLLNKSLMPHYVTKTSAPREVYFEKLSKFRKMVELKTLFVGSGTFINAKTNSYNVLIVDEAHRLTKQTGFLKKGINQIDEIINASKFILFFIDEDQRVHIDDYGSIDTIKYFANKHNADITELELTSQFRCNGSNGYLAWLDNILQIRDTANYYFSKDEYDFDFRIYDNPTEMKNEIFRLNQINNKARIVAGYCWDWISSKNPHSYDIRIPQYNFNMMWNFKSYGGKWIIDSNSINEVGCIHTCQGLELDYIGVIVGDDFVIRNGKVIVQPHKRSSMDRSIFGYKKLMDTNPEEAISILNSIIKNTYRTLMTRGMKGCFVYFTDKETNEYFKTQLKILKKD